VIHIPHIGYEDISQLHAAADVFCLPSIPHEKWEEQFGYVLVEAMACGKPIVTTKCGAIPEIVIDSENGFLVAPGEKDELKNAIEDLLSNDGQKKEMGEKNWKRVKQMFDVVEIRKSLEKKYNQISS